MPTSPTTEAPAAFVCDCDSAVRSACDGLPFYKKREGKRYCVLHYPGKDKSAAFDEALERKLEAADYDFKGVWFPDEVDFFQRTFAKPANFRLATFSARVNFDSAIFRASALFHSTEFGADANFDSVWFDEGAQFDAATFGAKANFDSSKFGAGAGFVSATFGAEASFDNTAFGARVSFASAAFGAGANFHYAEFHAEAFFYSVMFGARASFDRATFRAKADFSYATFKDYVMFAGTERVPAFSRESSLNLQFARSDRPDRVSFHTLGLRPHWFVNVDARKFEFINVGWGSGHIRTKREIDDLEQGIVSSPHRLLSIACRNLAVNAEENHRYTEASRLRFMAMDARRLERWRGFAFWSLGWWYWLASGYGESIRRAFVVLAGVWLLAAALYTQVGFVRWEPRVSSEQEAWEAKRDEAGQPLRWQRALTYSLGVMTLQRPEPRPATDAAQAVVMLETILGPVQAALLALAIRRKFMR